MLPEICKVLIFLRWIWSGATRFLCVLTGLSNMVEDDMLLDIVSNTYIGDVVDELINEAKGIMAG